MLHNNVHTNRRTWLKTVAVGVTTGLAGCTGGNNGDGGPETTAQGTTVGSRPEDYSWDDHDALAELDHDEWRDFVVSKIEEEESGQITYYGSSGEDNEPLVREKGGLDYFDDRYGVLSYPEVVNIRGGDIYNRYVREVASDEYIMDAADMSGATKIYHDEGIPMGSVYDIPSWRDLPDSAKSHPFAGGTTVPTYGISYNTELVDQPPETWDALLDDRFSDGKILITHTSNPGNNAAFLNEIPEDVLQGIAEDQNPSYEDSTLSTARRVAEGGFHIGIVTQLPHVNRFAADLPVGHTSMEFPETAIFTPPSPNVLAARPNNPWSAKLYLDWLWHVENQEVHALESGSLSIHGDFARPMELLETFEAAGGLSASQPTQRFDQPERFDELVNWPLDL